MIFEDEVLLFNFVLSSSISFRKYFLYLIPKIIFERLSRNNSVLLMSRKYI